MRKFVFICLLLVLCAPVVARADDDGEEKKLPIPRFVSLKADETNVRAGPGTRYSINWVYKKAGLPVEVIKEFDSWRMIRDSESSTAWVHKNMLSGRRMALILKKTRALYRLPDGKSAMLKAEPGVTAQLLACQKNWCRLQIDSRKGWMKKSEFFGAYPNETFGN